MATKQARNTLLAPVVGEGEFDNTYTDVAQYGTTLFWDERYVTDPEPFEWYYGYEYFHSIIKDALPKFEANIMMAGCGTSHMMEDMVEAGYTKLTGLDISRVAMEILKVRCKTYPEITLVQGTMMDTDLPEHSFDGVIDKAVFDSIICAGVGSTSVKQYLQEVIRLLDDEGVFICISHGNPEQRLPYLEQYDLELPGFTPWTVEVLAMQKPAMFKGEELKPDDPSSYYFLYICRISDELKKKQENKQVKDQYSKKKKKKKTKAPAL